MYYCVLTGGKSRRMGQDKAFLDMGGRYVVEVLIERFMGEGRKLCLSSADGDVAARLIHLSENMTHLPGEPMSLQNKMTYRSGGLTEVADIVQGAGPMGGIYSLLKVLGEDVFVMATDMPFADVRLAELIIAAACGEMKTCSQDSGMVDLGIAATGDERISPVQGGGRSGPADLCLLEREDGRLEPLFGFYSLACLKPMEAMLAQGNYRLSSLADCVHVRRIPETALAKAYGTGWERALFNMNTPEDYVRAMEIYQKVC